MLPRSSFVLFITKYEHFILYNFINLIIFQDCIRDKDSGLYTKDLRLVDEDLSNVVILDNSPYAYRNFPGILKLLLVHCITISLIFYLLIRLYSL